MNLNQLAAMLDKIHLAIYHEPSSHQLTVSDRVVRLYFGDEFIELDNIIDPLRFRLVFPDYVGKIEAFRNLFGYILENSENVCDTGDFILLTNSEARRIDGFIQAISLDELRLRI